MTAIAKKKSYRVAKAEIKRKLNAYDWADNLFFNGVIKAPVLHTLKAIIACEKLIKPTHKQINDARTRSCSKKFAQSDAIDLKTIGRHIKFLETLKLITVVREYVDWGWRCTYTINYKSDSCHEDIMSSSISSPNPFRISSYAARFKCKRKEQKQTPVSDAIAASQHITYARGTKLYDDALAALKGDGIVAPDTSLPDAIYYKLLTEFEIQLSNKMNFLLEEKNNVSADI